MPRDLILGTAGHIDHGKTALVRALTGTDTDRLPEEKRRGITIDLGFAYLELGDFHLGVVDVPGHERFVRNMLAGATGVDLALLVVSAEEGIKPQTREHFDILRLLGVTEGVIALTKCDTVDADWLAMIRDQVRQFVTGSFLAQADCIATSALTGAGLDDLRAALARAAARAAAGPRQSLATAPFRLPMDRAFAVAGHGTVVTGSVVSGRCRVGDDLELQPGGLPVRVRGLECHGMAVESVARGQRAAVNLAGVHHTAVARGQELATPGHLVPSKVLTARLEVLATVPRPLFDRARVHLHLGTAELMATVRLITWPQPSSRCLPPGGSGLAQLFLAQAVVATWSQPLVVRSESPVTTLGGGRVLDPQARPLGKPTPATAQAVGELEADAATTRAAAAIQLARLEDWEPTDLARLVGVPDAPSVLSTLDEAGTVVTLRLSATRTAWVHRQTLEAFSQHVLALLTRRHQTQPQDALVERSAILARMARWGSPARLAAALAWLEASGQVRADARGIALRQHTPSLPPADKQLLDRLVDKVGRGGLEPPTPEQLKRDFRQQAARVVPLLKFAAAHELLVHVGDDLYLHPDTVERLRSKLQAELAKFPQGLTVSQLREVWGTTRKYAVPLCEYFDRLGVTRRVNDRRVLTG